MTKALNALDALLKADFKTEKKVYLSRLKTHFTVRAVTTKETEDIKDQATHYTGKPHNLKKEHDSVKAMYLTVVKGVVVPDLNDKQLKEKAGNVSSAWEVVKELLLPGEVQKLEQEILILSGFDDEEAEEKSYEEIKN